MALASPSKGSPGKAGQVKANGRANARPESESWESPGPLKLLIRAFTETNEVWEKDELLDVIHWQRQIWAVIIGLLYGALPFTGLWAFLSFILLNILLVLSWWRVQRIDEDEYGGMGPLIGEGLPPAVALFLLVWIMTYTLAH